MNSPAKTATAQRAIGSGAGFEDPGFAVEHYALTRLAALGTLSRTAGEGRPDPQGRVGEGSAGRRTSSHALDPATAEHALRPQHQGDDHQHVRSEILGTAADIRIEIARRQV